jgi:hypothetical protein
MQIALLTTHIHLIIAFMIDVGKLPQAPPAQTPQEDSETK